MAEKNESIYRVGEHRYRVTDTTTTGKSPLRFIRGQPVRETKFRPISRNAPRIEELKTFNRSQMNSPVAVRQMTDVERRDQRIRNAVGAIGAGAIVGQTASGVADYINPHPDQGIISQIMSHNAEYRRKLKAGVDPNVLGAKEVVELHRKHPIYRRFPWSKLRTEEDTYKAVRTANRLGPIDLAQARRAYSRQLFKNKYLAGGAALGAGVAGARELAERKRPNPYYAQYGTGNMKRLRREG